LGILVTGAAGYIGSILTEELVKVGYRVIAVDNLRQGHREAVFSKATFINADIGDSEKMANLFSKFQVDTVIHLAAESTVSQSMSDPGEFFQNNVTHGINLLDVMLKHGVDKLVFSSSAAVYGEPESVPIKETALERPLNPYGESKLIFERILHWYREAYGLKFISLRFFNVAGASQQFGEDHHPETHLIPNILKVALGQQGQISVFGDSYPTKDGSCVRDYVHVIDVARAHMLALKCLAKNARHDIYNLGNGSGFSVFEVVEAAREVTGTQIPISLQPSRRGDPAVLIADAELAKIELGWKPEFTDIESIIDSAWQWQKRYPHGYTC
jgi:UDP-glucose 4-epimerase